MEAIDLKGLMEDVGELLHGTVISHQARLRIEAAPALPAILGDPVHLQQLLLNLILNALEAMENCPPEKRHVLVRATTSTRQGVEVTVADQGPGFPKWQMSRLFEPFLSTKKNGMGMGLAICQTIVQAHGGHLTAVNNPDRGATLRFTLPRTYSKKEESE
jgi:two-component system, LuxR family, sensor kinase FixL